MRQQPCCCNSPHLWASLQALRLESVASWNLGNSSLVAIASMCDRLRQLALIELEIVSDDSVMAALSQLSMLQVIPMALEVLRRTHTTLLLRRLTREMLSAKCQAGRLYANGHACPAQV